MRRHGNALRVFVAITATAIGAGSLYFQFYGKRPLIAALTFYDQSLFNWANSFTLDNLTVPGSAPETDDSIFNDFLVSASAVACLLCATFIVYWLFRFVKRRWREAIAIAALITIGGSAIPIYHNWSEQRARILGPPQVPVYKFDYGATHILQILVKLNGSTIAPHDSVPLECTAKLVRKIFAEQSVFPDEILLRLAPEHRYSASADFKSVGFDVATLGPEPKATKPLHENLPQSWTWILTPKAGKEGGTQFTAIDFFIYDDTEKTLIWDGPVAKLTVAVGTPLGLPSWLISPQFAFTSLVSGAAALLVPWLLQTYGPKRKERLSEPKRDS